MKRDDSSAKFDDLVVTNIHKSAGARGSARLLAAGAQLDQAPLARWRQGLFCYGAQREDVVDLFVRVAWRVLLPAGGTLFRRAATMYRIRISAAATSKTFASEDDSDGHRAHQERKRHHGDQKSCQHV